MNIGVHFERVTSTKVSKLLSGKKVSKSIMATRSLGSASYNHQKDAMTSLALTSVLLSERK